MDNVGSDGPVVWRAVDVIVAFMMSAFSIVEVVDNVASAGPILWTAMDVIMGLMMSPFSIVAVVDNVASAEPERCFGQRSPTVCLFCHPEGCNKGINVRL